jgi:hypothetical protein
MPHLVQDDVLLVERAGLGLIEDVVTDVRRHAEAGRRTSRKGARDQADHPAASTLDRLAKLVNVERERKVESLYPCCADSP